MTTSFLSFWLVLICSAQAPGSAGYMAGPRPLLAEADPRAQFKRLEPEFAAFLKLGLGTDTEAFAERLNVLLKAFGGLDKGYRQVIAGREPHASISALVRLGEAYFHLYRSFRTFPLPKGLTREQSEIFSRELENRSDPFKDRAEECFQRALTFAKDHGINDEWTALARKYLTGPRLGAVQPAPAAAPPTRDELRRALSAEGKKFQDCANQEASPGDSAVQGTVVFAVVVNRTGYVEHVEVTSKAFAGTTFADCVEKIIRGLRLKPFTGKAVVLEAFVDYGTVLAR